MAPVTWYFDFISPYAYFGLLRLQELPADAQVTLQPILFAGVLNHWGQKGPAEIEPKRVWTYQSCVWLAQQRGWPFRMPARHPFNPLPYLRLAIAARNAPAAIRKIFDALWTTGVDPADGQVIAGLARSLDVDPARMTDQGVKEALRLQTDAAVARGVFGVPTFAIGDRVFWGADSLDFAAAYLRDPQILATAEMQRAAMLPTGADRLRH
jgi:2-hydroxychromene-2-carboxylate isomerase